MKKSHRLRRVLRAFLLGVIALVALVTVGGGVMYLLARPAMGGTLADDQLARVERSPQWREGRFRNRLPRVDGPPGEMMREFFFGGSKFRSPSAPIAPVQRTGADYGTPPASGLRATWFGHSTVLVEIDGRRVLFDPMWSERASPLGFVGPKRFFLPSLPLAELPPIDAVVISHDHYDHLDMPTVKTLAARGTRFFVPLGIGAHLRSWGVPAADVTELDWWEAAEVNGLTITATPSRHFSGRGLTDADRTLWGGWSVRGDGNEGHRVFYSGDTALHDELAEVGRRLGPFDLTLIEVGEYDAMWADVHLGPEQAVIAHQLVRGDVMLPVHWAGFDLALHGWTEPMERTLVAANAAGVRVATPRPGEMMEPATLGAPTRWWPTVPWKTAAEAPANSTGVEHLRR